MESNDSGFIWFPKNNFAGIRQSVTLTPDEFINNSIYKIKNKSDLKGHWIGEVYVKPGASMKLLKQKERKGLKSFMTNKKYYILYINEFRSIGSR
jgi:hypothetical protein